MADAMKLLNGAADIAMSKKKKPEDDEATLVKWDPLDPEKKKKAAEGMAKAFGTPKKE